MQKAVRQLFFFFCCCCFCRRGRSSSSSSSNTPGVRSSLSRPTASFATSTEIPDVPDSQAAGQGMRKSTDTSSDEECVGASLLRGVLTACRAQIVRGHQRPAQVAQRVHQVGHAAASAAAPLTRRARARSLALTVRPRLSVKRSPSAPQLRVQSVPSQIELVVRCCVARYRRSRCAHLHSPACLVAARQRISSDAQPVAQRQQHPAPAPADVLQPRHVYTRRRGAVWHVQHGVVGRHFLCVQRQQQLGSRCPTVRRRRASADDAGRSRPRVALSHYVPVKTDALLDATLSRISSSCKADRRRTRTLAHHTNAFCCCV